MNHALSSYHAYLNALSQKENYNGNPWKNTNLHPGASITEFNDQILSAKIIRILAVLERTACYVRVIKKQTLDFGTNF